MSEKIIELEEKVNPIRLTDNDTGEVYELDFDRASIEFAERRGFKISEVPDYPVSLVPELFYYSFRKNHKRISKQKADAIFDALGGLTPAMLERLTALYNQGALTHVIRDDEGEEKNPKMTVEL